MKNMKNLLFTLSLLVALATVALGQGAKTAPALPPGAQERLKNISDLRAQHQLEYARLQAEQAAANLAERVVLLEALLSANAPANEIDAWEILRTKEGFILKRKVKSE